MTITVWCGTSKALPTPGAPFELFQPWLSGPLAMLLPTVTLVTEKGFLVVYEGCVLVRTRVCACELVHTRVRACVCVCACTWYAWVERYLY